MSAAALCLMRSVAGQTATAATADGVFGGHLMLRLAEMAAGTMLAKDRVGRTVLEAVQATVSLVWPLLLSQGKAGYVNHALAAVHQTLHDVIRFGHVTSAAGLFGVIQPAGMKYQTVVGELQSRRGRVAEVAGLALVR